MVSRALLFLLLATPAAAQFFGLATPANGSRVYFATTLKQKGVNQASWGKLFQADANGIRLTETREYQVPEPPPIGVATGIGLAHPTNPYNLQAASVSADGRTMAVTGWRDCVSGGSYCYKMEHLFTTITASGKPADYPGQLRLSPDGAWAFGNTEHPSYDESLYQARLVNVKTGELTGISQFALGDYSMTESGRPVANNGTAVFVIGHQLSVLAGGKLQRYANANGWVLEPVIDASGRVVVYTYCAVASAAYGCPSVSQRSLRAIDPRTGGWRTLSAEGMAPVMDDAGTVVMYVSRRSGTPQLRLVRIDGSDDRELTRDPAGITRAVLSGDGGTAFAVTLAGRLIRVDTATGRVEELVARTPVWGEAQGPKVSYIPPLEFAAGKLVEIPGNGFSDAPLAASAPLPDSLGGVTLNIQGKRAKLLAVNPSSLLAVAPPDVTPGEATVAISVDSHSPFETPPPPVGGVAQFGASFLYLEGRFGPAILTVHQDWSGLVTPESPAMPGEIVHSYAAGLGATVPAVAYGDAPPSTEPLARLTDPLSCADPGARMVIDVLYAGLAPGLPAVYQVDWRVPPVAQVNLLCVTASFATLITGTVPTLQ